MPRRRRGRTRFNAAVAKTTRQMRVGGEEPFERGEIGIAAVKDLLRAIAI